MRIKGNLFLSNEMRVECNKSVLLADILEPKDANPMMMKGDKSD
jgi:hypothetical protein